MLQSGFRFRKYDKIYRYKTSPGILCGMPGHFSNYTMNLLLVGKRVLDCLAGAFDSLLEAADTGNGANVSKAIGDDAEADERSECHGRNVKIPEAEEAENGTGDTQNKKSPPVRESDFLVVEALDGDNHTFHHNPDGEYYRQGSGGPQNVEQEEAAEENVQQGAEHTGPAVGDELLGFQGEH